MSNVLVSMSSKILTRFFREKEDVLSREDVKSVLRLLYKCIGEEKYGKTDCESRKKVSEPEQCRPSEAAAEEASEGREGKTNQEDREGEHTREVIGDQAAAVPKLQGLNLARLSAATNADPSKSFSESCPSYSFDLGIEGGQTPRTVTGDGPSYRFDI